MLSYMSNGTVALDTCRRCALGPSNSTPCALWNSLAEATCTASTVFITQFICNCMPMSRTCCRPKSTTSARCAASTATSWRCTVGFLWTNCDLERVEGATADNRLTSCAREFAPRTAFAYSKPKNFPIEGTRAESAVPGHPDHATHARRAQQAASAAHPRE